jgi:two-component system sensor histidine kinase RegB
MPPSQPALPQPASTLRAYTDPIGLAWLVTVRWASVGAAIAALSVGHRVLGITSPVTGPALAIALTAVSNIILAVWRRRRPLPALVPGLLVTADVIVLSWLLMRTGGPLNPVSIFFLVYIVLTALVLGSRWAWAITALSVAGYGLLFLAPHPELVVAGQMHPEIGRHVAGMWWAFAATALLVALLVARLAASVARRDQALAVLRAQAERSARLAGLASLAAGAAHELSTPLGTIAVAVRELERSAVGASPAVREDIELIQAELRRCRAILDGLAGQAGQPAGEMPVAGSVGDVLDAVAASLSPQERPRVARQGETTTDVTWPRQAVARAVANLVRNGLQVSPAGADVTIAITTNGDGWIDLAIVDTGPGLAADVLPRIGEPFFTTKAEGHGMGLGVFISRNTVEQLGGTLVLHSSPGAGTRVNIRLPRHVAAPVDRSGATG